MEIEFITAAPADTSAGHATAVLAFEPGLLSAPARHLDAKLGGALSRAFNPRFHGTQRSHVVIRTDQSTVLLTGGGPADADLAVEELAAYACQAANAAGIETLVLHLPSTDAGIAARAAFGARLSSYRFLHHRRFLRPDETDTLKRLTIITSEPQRAQQAYQPLAALGDGVQLTRDLNSEPANVLYPAEFARRLQALERPGLTVEILGAEQLQQLGMGSLLCVGQGSARESQLVILHWRGGPDPDAAPVAFVGKGVTFDSGGLSIKPTASMEDMKWDMGGAGAIAGLLLALAGRRAAVNVVGVLGLVENMVDGNSIRPGDIVTSMSGRTIEVINTDAEGRLVLADALWYCEERFQPCVMIDVATLTGAVMVALGTDYAGLYCEDETLSTALLAAGETTGELLWRMPMPASYDRHLQSAAADLRNVAKIRFGGASIAARFLRHFVRRTPWAHLDISSPTWRDPAGSPLAPAGATGFGVRLLEQYVRDQHEAI